MPSQVPSPTAARGGRGPKGAATLALLAFPGILLAETPRKPPGNGVREAVKPAIYIEEYRVSGSTVLSQLEIGEAVYPFLGPGRTEDDIEKARVALEEAYQKKGFKTVAVEITPQTLAGGVVDLQVVENRVGRVRVNGARYFLPSTIQRQAPSLAPGTLPNFADVERDLRALNQWPDRQVTPVLQRGLTPGTVDIDLNVKDTFPLHGSVELNNRYSADTSELRLNGSLTYNNLWQLGHSIGASFQLSPQEPDEVKVFSGFYTARFSQWPGFSWLIQGTKQDSNVSTLGGSAVAGRGEVLGTRAIFTLPQGEGFYHSVNFGFDYKHYDQVVQIGATELTTPVTYYPITAGYSASWFEKDKFQTELNAAVTLNLRGTGSDDVEFDNNRFKARGSFIYLRGDVAHTRELLGGGQIYAKVQGQASSQPLVSSEQFAGGGLGTTRGYVEAETLGDNAIFGTLELRTPSLLRWTKRAGNEWRLYAFLEGGLLTLQEPLPEQESRFELASVGLGTRLQLFEYFHGSLDAGLPLTSQRVTEAGEWMFTFRLWAEF